MSDYEIIKSMCCNPVELLIVKIFKKTFLKIYNTTRITTMNNMAKLYRYPKITQKQKQKIAKI